MDPQAALDDLEIAFDEAVTAYFERVLPCFLTAHLRGGGYTLVAEMMLHIDGPAAPAWIRENHPPEGQARVFGPWYLAAAKSGPGLTNRLEHRAWFTPR